MTPRSESEFQFQPNRTVVGTENIGINRRGLDPVCKTVRDQKIVDAPAGVVLPGIEPVAPPAVDACGIRIEMTEGIGETGFQKLSEAFPLLIGEAGVSTVGRGVLQVNLLMGHIQVTTHNDRLTGVQLHQVIPECFVPF